MVKKMWFLCTFSRNRNKDFLSFRAFLSVFLMTEERKKISTKNRKMSQTMKSFFFFAFSFNKDFPLIFTDAILINFLRREWKSLRDFLAFSRSFSRFNVAPGLQWANFHADFPRFHIAIEINLQPCVNDSNTAPLAKRER